AAGKERVTLRGSKGQVFAVALSPDGKLLATGNGIITSPLIARNVAKAARTSPLLPSMTGEVTLWDATTGQQVRTPGTHSGGISDLVFAPDGRTLASASAGSVDYQFQWGLTEVTSHIAHRPGQLKLWDVAAGRERVAVDWPHRGGIWCLAYDPSGRSVAAGG